MEAKRRYPSSVHGRAEDHHVVLPEGIGALARGEGRNVGDARFAEHLFKKNFAPSIGKTRHILHHDGRGKSLFYQTDKFKDQAIASIFAFVFGG